MGGWWRKLFLSPFLQGNSKNYAEQGDDHTYGDDKAGDGGKAGPGLIVDVCKERIVELGISKDEIVGQDSGEDPEYGKYDAADCNIYTVDPSVLFD